MLALEPGELEPWDGYAEFSLFLRDEAEYRRARKELLERFGSSADPRVAERVGRACLFLPASEEELRQATNLILRALAFEQAKPDWLLPYFRFAKALAEYRVAGRLDSAPHSALDGDTQQSLGAGTAPCCSRWFSTASARRTLHAQLSRGGRRLRLGCEEGDGPRSLDVPPVAARGRNRAGVQAVADSEPSRMSSAGHCFARRSDTTEVD